MIESKVEREMRPAEPEKSLHHKCPACELWYQPRRATQVYCGDVCRWKSQRDRGRSTRNAQSNAGPTYS